MSRATPLDNTRREAIYLRQSGRSELTPAQSRRLRKKENEQARPLPRTGRLRRRFDKTADAQIRKDSRTFVEVWRNHMHYARYVGNPARRARREFRRAAYRRTR